MDLLELEPEHKSASILLLKLYCNLQPLQVWKRIEERNEHKNTENAFFSMRGLKTSRFDIEESSWNCDLSETVCKLLEAIPEEDASIDVPEVLYECLTETVSLLECHQP